MTSEAYLSIYFKSVAQIDGTTSAKLCVAIGIPSKYQAHLDSILVFFIYFSDWLNQSHQSKLVI